MNENYNKDEMRALEAELKKQTEKQVGGVIIRETAPPANEEERSFRDKVVNVLKTLIFEAVAFDTPINKDPRREYPATVAECIDDKVKYKAETYTAMKKFRESQPWKGTQGEMQFKFRSLNEDLAKIYGIPTPQLVFVDKFPVGPCCFPESKPAVIMLQPEKDGRYGVVCFLHEFAHALGKDEKGACKWSLNLFKRLFPKSYAALEPKGHLLFRKKDGKDEPGKTDGAPAPELAQAEG